MGAPNPVPLRILDRFQLKEIGSGLRINPEEVKNGHRDFNFSVRLRCPVFLGQRRGLPCPSHGAVGLPLNFRAVGRNGFLPTAPDTSFNGLNSKTIGASVRRSLKCLAFVLRQRQAGQLRGGVIT